METTPRSDLTVGQLRKMIADLPDHYLVGREYDGWTEITQDAGVIEDRHYDTGETVNVLVVASGGEFFFQEYGAKPLPKPETEADRG